MKKYIITALFVSLVPTLAFAQFTVPQGGTGKTGFPQNAWLYADNGGLQRVQASSSPTVGYIVATTTTASRFVNASTTNITSALASTTNLTVSGFPLTILSTTGSGAVQLTTVSSPLSFSGSTLSCPTCNTSASNVISVTATNSTLTISPTTGNVLAGINLANSNAWSALQTFTRASSTQMTFQGPVYDNTNSAGTSGQVFTSNGANVAPSWQAASGASGGYSTPTLWSTTTNAIIDTNNPFQISSTTVGFVSGNVYNITASCSYNGGGGNSTSYLDVFINGGGTTTTARSVYDSSSNGRRVTSTFSVFYTATTTATGKIIVDNESFVVRQCENGTMTIQILKPN